jgi:hypothetical protein
MWQKSSIKAAIQRQQCGNNVADTHLCIMAHGHCWLLGKVSFARKGVICLERCPLLGPRQQHAQGFAACLLCWCDVLMHLEQVTAVTCDMMLVLMLG